MMQQITVRLPKPCSQCYEIINKGQVAWKIKRGRNKTRIICENCYSEIAPI